jgi:tryptophan synthase alpha chain
MREALLAHGVDLICLVGLNTPVERMREYAKVPGGLSISCAVLGTTGVRESLPERIKTAYGRAAGVRSACGAWVWDQDAGPA